jgi:hypothetical protein
MRFSRTPTYYHMIELVRNNILQSVVSGHFQCSLLRLFVGTLMYDAKAKYVQSRLTLDA